ncbi:DUF1934 domain-containing protein [Cohnella pontilimi]|uniref:DUF1934 domain-containing protein n=1 Tax=Cohnella pontilimi TaxID=2564100 RepID=A0A4U0F441_9BACL|nr:DUF1934 domain-containing protein [Cohnella pontilimi]TJY38978.1 DUF1934 domain-containing protein [Cohnella pontilimi]
MPDRTSVSVGFRIRRPDAEDQLLSASGHLYRMATGWALTCRFPDEAGVSDMTLVVRNSEIRMNRKGTVAQEQLFLVGEWKPGTVGTPFGAMAAETWTHRIDQDLTPAGGSVEWVYDLKMMGTTFECCSIKLEIREEQT